MCPDGTFQQKNKFYNRNWQFISVYEVNSGTAAECASTAEANYVTAANGWERVSNNTVLDESVNDYFFAIVSANYPGIMVNMANGNASQQASEGYTTSKSMWYSNSANPEANNSFLWMIEKCNESDYEGYTFRNASYPSLTIQAESGKSYFAHTHDQPNPCRWSSYALTPTDGVFTIKTLANGGTNYLGLWTPSNDYTNGQELAGNKGESEKGQFLIYRIAKDNLDMTSRITNPTFDSNNSGWTATGGFSNNQIANNKGGDFTVPFWENWDGTAKANKMYQNLTNLPNGFYKVKIAAFVNNLAENNSSQYVFANNDKTYLVTTSPKYYEVWTEVTDNTLSIGLEQTTATANWMGIDNVSLTYSSSLPESLTPITGKMNAAVEAAQTSAVDAYAASRTVANINAAMKAKAAAEVSKAAYANAANYLESVEAVLATTNFYTPTAYNSVYDTYKTAYDAGTLDDATAAGLTYKVAGSGGTERYTYNTANNLLIPGWTIDGNDAITTNSGFYINTWSVEGNNDGSGFQTPFFEYWTSEANSLGEATMASTMTGLDANREYSLDIWARVRQTNGQTKVNNKITLQLSYGDAIDISAGEQVGTSQFYIKHFKAYGRSDESGNLTITINVADGSNVSWLAFRDVNYTRLADDDDYTALNSAIIAAEAHTLGFESGEYAPYNHAEVLQTLASAKTINSGENNSQLTVRTLTSTLNNASWTANAADVDAIYNNDFALATDGWNPDGWTSTGWAAKVDDINSSSSISETGKGWRPNTGTITYGSTGVYTMPLAANQLYKLTFKYGAWDGTPVPRISVLNGENGLAATELPGTSTNYKTAMNSWTMYFRTGVAGNYVLSMYASYNMVWTDVSLIKAEESEISLSESTDFTPATNTYYQTLKLGRTFPTDKVSTMVLPFAMNATATAAAFDKVYELSDVDGEIIKFTTADAITAGKPYIVKAKEDAVVFASNIKSSELVSDVTPVTEGTVTFTGTFSRIADLLDVTNSYIISNNNLYEVDSKVALKPFRGYFTITPSLVKAFVLDFGDATGINTIANSQQPMANGPIYNLAGQRLSKAQKGIYIINGKKVLVK